MEEELEMSLDRVSDRNERWEPGLGLVHGQEEEEEVHVPPALPPPLPVAPPRPPSTWVTKQIHIGADMVANLREWNERRYDTQFLNTFRSSIPAAPAAAQDLEDAVGAPDVDKEIPAPTDDHVPADDPPAEDIGQVAGGEAPAPRSRLVKKKPRNRGPAAQNKPVASKKGQRASYGCLFCPGAFVTPSQLEIHVRVHTRECPFWCGVCGKECATQGNLAKHRRKHTGIKPYQCPVCSKGFDDLSNFHRHEKMHSGEKSLMCESCGKTFSLKANLTEHRIVHTGERHFKCQECGKKFAQAASLTRHRKQAHGAAGKLGLKKGN